jgi:hypothetical protein
MPKLTILGMLVKDRNKNKNDSLDTFRYILDAEFAEFGYN